MVIVVLICGIATALNRSLLDCSALRPLQRPRNFLPEDQDGV